MVAGRAGVSKSRVLAAWGGEIETGVGTCAAFNNIDPDMLVGVELHVGCCGSGEVEEVLVATFMEFAGLLFRGFGCCAAWEDVVYIYPSLTFRFQLLSGEVDT